MNRFKQIDPIASHNRCQRRTQRHGVAAVEMAFVLPLFVMLIFGIVEFGRAMMCMQILTNTAREGARACAVSPLTATEVETICQEYAEGCGIPNLVVTVSPDPTTVIRGEPISVTVEVDFSEVAFIPPFYARDTTLRTRSIMRKEREFD